MGIVTDLHIHSSFSSDLTLAITKKKSFVTLLWVNLNAHPLDFVHHFPQNTAQPNVSRPEPFELNVLVCTGLQFDFGWVQFSDEKSFSRSISTMHPHLVLV